VERILRKLAYLQIEIFISSFFEKLFAAFIDQRFNFEAAADAEFDIFGVA
jgi:hypothetical protein